ncbi:MAG: ATP-binding protein [Endomicrobium sp.]|uniref:ATP-binding protein n=1 Tax=Candidatus Endomicrobiellum pyrsonymphae TaxID=1408203 RepID=UPI0035753429|nr:ATP-binding protein [Endomicrobium sp.]
MSKNELELTFTSLQTELAGYKYEPLKCLFEYLWNSFDAGATEIKINYILPETGIGDIYSISIEDNGLGWDFENETLEPKHLQKVLDKNFWIFGEQFKLFASTEGALRNTLLRYAKDVLQIEDTTITTTSRKEVDLFLIKTLSETETCQRNIIIEIKRPSKIIGKEEYDQIKSYSTEIMKESICNSTNTYWEFYLVGNGYDGTIDDAIENAKNHGEAQKGLTENIKNGRVKIYVRKWSDILEVEWKHKMEYLKEKIQTQAKNIHYENPQEIVEQYTKTK